MPPEPGSAVDWLRHAASDLELARVERTPIIMVEGLCFHTQQAAEKALKGVLVHSGVAFPMTHNIRTLIDLLPARLTVPAEVQAAAGLTDYAVLARYPTHVEPVTEAEYADAVSAAEAVVGWAQGVVANAL